jgi:hypothetical protein
METTTELVTAVERRETATSINLQCLREPTLRIESASPVDLAQPGQKLRLPVPKETEDKTLFVPHVDHAPLENITFSKKTSCQVVTDSIALTSNQESPDGTARTAPLVLSFSIV